jgi:hypothetical protein
MNPFVGLMLLETGVLWKNKRRAGHAKSEAFPSIKSQLRTSVKARKAFTLGKTRTPHGQKPISSLTISPGHILSSRVCGWKESKSVESSGTISLWDARSTPEGTKMPTLHTV